MSLPRVLSFHGGKSNESGSKRKNSILLDPVSGTPITNNQYLQYQPPYISNQTNSYSQYYSGSHSRSNSNSSQHYNKDQHQPTQNNTQHHQEAISQDTTSNPKSHKKSLSSISFNRRSSLLNPNRNSVASNSSKRLSLSSQAAPQPFDSALLPRSNSTASNLDSMSQKRMSLRSQSMVSDISVYFPTDFPKDTPPEMMPILTLLNAHKNREYNEGYLMILNDLNSDGKPSADRRWVEVYGKLTGTVLSIWDATSLESADDEPTPVYINITDSTFKTIPLLPSPNGDLANIIVLSTTLKNRYLLQFATPTLLHGWTAALRLALFENTSLQEAYTGALLSSKGSKLNGIRTLLTETKFRHEDYVSVRFGSGMPWKKCWAVVSPSDVKKKKHLPPPCTIAFYEDKKKVKCPPLALITGAYAAYAVYPQSSILINGSTMIKIEGKVAFNDVEGEKDASVFIMPEAHAGVPGFETLIRFLIPVLDAFHMYGRPQRLNADKADMRSLLFGMPSLPFTQYLEVNDVEMLVSLNGADHWTLYDWTRNMKDLLARKISTGYKGTGKLSRPVSYQPVRGRDRSISQPIPVDMRGALPRSALGSVNERTIAGSREPSIAPQQSTVSVTSSNYDGNMGPPAVPAHASGYSSPVRRAPPPPTSNGFHERSASTGADPNNLLSTVNASTQPISPLVPNTPGFEGARAQEYEQHRNSGLSIHTDPNHHVHRRPVSQGFEPDTVSIPSALDASQPLTSLPDGHDMRRYTTHEQQQYEMYGEAPYVEQDSGLRENQYGAQQPNPYAAPVEYR